MPRAIAVVVIGADVYFAAWFMPVHDYGEALPG